MPSTPSFGATAPGQWLVGVYYFKNSSPQFSFHFGDETMARSQKQLAEDEALGLASVDVTRRGDSNLNVIEWAVSHDHWPVVKQALKGKFTWDQVGNIFKDKVSEVSPELLDAPDGNRQTLLMWASRTGHEAIIMSLVAAKADLDLKDAEGRTALSHAIAGGRVRVVKFLVEKGARTSDEKFLDLALRDGEVSLVEKFVSRGMVLDSAYPGIREALVAAVRQAVTPGSSLGQQHHAAVVTLASADATLEVPHALDAEVFSLSAAQDVPALLDAVLKILPAGNEEAGVGMTVSCLGRALEEASASGREGIVERLLAR